jgi:hypothetical protein
MASSSVKRIQTQAERNTNVPPIADIKGSKLGVVTPDRVTFPISELFLHIERPVDFEALRVNGCGNMKQVFVHQKMTTYLDCLNGPVYSEIVKDFWMKAQVCVSNQIPAEEYYGKEIRSEVGGVLIRIRPEHIRQAVQ